MTDRRDILNVADIPTRTFHSGPRFEAALGDIDGALGTTQIGATLHVVPAGKTAWPFHRHHGNDELFYVVSGEGTYRVGERRLPIKTGDLIGAPAGGEAHQIINTSSGELRYIAFANHGRAGGNVSRRVHNGILGQKGGKLLVERHGLIITSSGLCEAGND